MVKALFLAFSTLNFYNLNFLSLYFHPIIVCFLAPSSLFSPSLLPHPPSTPFFCFGAVRFDGFVLAL